MAWAYKMVSKQWQAREGRPTIGRCWGKSSIMDYTTVMTGGKEHEMYSNSMRGLTGRRDIKTNDYHVV